MGPRSTENPLSQVEESLRTLQQQVTGIISARLPPYMSDHFWEKASVEREIKAHSVPQSIHETDPDFIQFSKHVLFTLRGLEALVGIIQEYNQGGSFLTARIRAARAGSAILSLLYDDLAGHISELTRLASQMDLPTTALDSLKTATDLFSALQFEQIIKPEIMKNFAGALAPINNLLPEFVNSFLYNRPTASLANKHHPVQDEKESKGTQPRKKNLEPTLIEPVRGVQSEIVTLANFIIEQIPKEKKQSEHLDKGQEWLVKKILSTIKNSKIDENGFYIYSSEETPLSQSIKGLFNMLWAINEIAQGHWEKNKISAYYQTVTQGSKAWENFKKIDWQGMSVDLRLIFDKLIDGALIYARENFVAPLTVLAHQTQALERQMHLNPGAILSADICSLFDPIESLYLQRGLVMQNPFIMSETEEKSLELKTASEEKRGNDQTKANDLLAATSILLKQYRDLGKVSTAIREITPIVTSHGTAYLLNPISPYVSSLLGGYLPGLIPNLITTAISFTPKEVSSILKKTGGKAGALIVSDIEVFKRKLFTDFPRITLLQNIAKIRNFNLFSMQENQQFDALEDHLISELSAEEKTNLHSKLSGEIEDIQKKIQHVEAQIQQHQQEPDTLHKLHTLMASLPTSHPLQSLQRKLTLALEAKEVKTESNFIGSMQSTAKQSVKNFRKSIAQWPPKIVTGVIEVVSKKNQQQAQQRYSYLADKSAITAYKNQKREYALRQLEKAGISPFLIGSSPTLESKETNLATQRQLAAILADLSGNDRESYLADASTIASTFASNPDQIKLFILSLIQSENPREQTLGKTLALETLLTGQIKQWDDDLFYEEAEPSHYFIQMADHLTASQLLEIIREKPKIDPSKELTSEENQKIKRAAALRTLLTHQTLSKRKMEHEYKSLHQEDFSKESLIEQLLNCYFNTLQKMNHNLRNKLPTDHERAVMHKTICMMGKLACADAEIAKIIFHDSQTQQIFKKEADESLKKSGDRMASVLYYEALVNCFNIPDPQGNDTRTRQDFLNANSDIILCLYCTLYPNKEVSAEEILSLYTTQPWILAKHLEKFITQFLSPGSAAEEKMRAFFSAFTLCQDNQELRLKIFEIHRDSQYSANAPYIKLLTPNSINSFWSLARTDLIKQYKTLISTDLTNNLSNITDYIPDVDSTRKKAFIAKITQETEEARKKILNITNELALQEQGLPLKCRIAEQEMKVMHDKLLLSYETWRQEAGNLQKINLLEIQIQELKKDFSQKINILKNTNHLEAKDITVVIQSQEEALENLIKAIDPASPHFDNDFKLIQVNINDKKNLIDNLYKECITELSSSTIPVSRHLPPRP